MKDTEFKIKGIIEKNPNNIYVIVYREHFRLALDKQIGVSGDVLLSTIRKLKRKYEIKGVYMQVCSLKEIDFLTEEDSYEY